MHPEIIIAILQAANKGKGGSAQFLSAYQILNRYPKDQREALVAEYGLSGKGAGKKFSAASYVAQIARGLENVEVIFVDTDGMLFKVGEDTVEPGYTVCAFYRLT